VKTPARHLGSWLLLLAACVAPVEVPQRPLVLPTSVDARGTGATLSLVVYGVPAPLEPPVLGTSGVVAGFSWQGADLDKPGGRLLFVDTGLPRGSVFLQLATDGGVIESNRVRLDAATVAFAEPPDVPQLVPWSAGSAMLLIVARDFGSGRLVDVDGRELPASSFRCARPSSELLREAAMECTVVHRQPLGTAGFPGGRVRALVQTPAGPVLTPAVAPP
jgi:hypothetical protein